MYGGQCQHIPAKILYSGYFSRGDNFCLFFCHQVPSMKILPVKNNCTYKLWDPCAFFLFFSCFLFLVVSVLFYSIRRASKLGGSTVFHRCSPWHPKVCISFLKVSTVGIWHNSSLPIEMHSLALYLHFCMICLVSTGRNCGSKHAYH